MLPEPSASSGAFDIDAPKPSPWLSRRRALFEVLMCSGYPTQLSILALLAIFNVVPMVDGKLSPVFVFVLSGIDTIVLLGLVLLFLKLSDERPRDVFIGSRAIAPEVGVGFLLAPATFVIVIAVQIVIRALAPFLHNVPVNPFESLLDSATARAAFITLVVFAGGVREEVQRAFLLHRFEQRLGGGRFGLLVTSAAFGLGHTLQGWDAAIITALLGAGWGWVYLRRRSIAANVTSHATFNVVQVLAGLGSMA